MPGNGDDRVQKRLIHRQLNVGVRVRHAQQQPLRHRHDVVRAVEGNDQIGLNSKAVPREHDQFLRGDATGLREVEYLQSLGRQLPEQLGIQVLGHPPQLVGRRTTEDENSELIALGFVTDLEPLIAARDEECLVSEDVMESLVVTPVLDQYGQREWLPPDRRSEGGARIERGQVVLAEK